MSKKSWKEHLWKKKQDPELAAKSLEAKQATSPQNVSKAQRLLTAVLEKPASVNKEVRAKIEAEGYNQVIKGTIKLVKEDIKKGLATDKEAYVQKCMSDIRGKPSTMQFIKRFGVEPEMVEATIRATLNEEA